MGLKMTVVVIRQNKFLPGVIEPNVDAIITNELVIRQFTIDGINATFDLKIMSHDDRTQIPKEEKYNLTKTLETKIPQANMKRP